MSYDLAVFDPRLELRDRDAFEDWYDSTDDYGEDGSNNDPTCTTAALQAWFHEMRDQFAPLNGPYQIEDVNDPRNERAADYNFGSDLVYVTFSWSLAEDAYGECKRLAEKHGVGFLDVSSTDGAAWFPAANGRLEIAHASPRNEA